MGIPKDAWGSAWYNLGLKPGEMGNAVIDGDVDSKSDPAIFYYLSDLTMGDSMQVVDDRGTVRAFVVTGIQTYPFDAFPL